MSHFSPMHGEMAEVLKLIVILGFVYLMVRTFRGRKNAIREEEHSESKTIQELYLGFERMEKRVESLETLLMDRHQREKDNL